MKFFITFGKINLYLILPLACLGLSIADAFINTFLFKRKRGNTIITLLINSFGKMSNIFFFFIIKGCFYKNLKLYENITYEIKKEEKKLIDNKLLIFFVILFAYVIYLVYYVISRDITIKPKLIYASHSYGLFTQECLEIFVIFLVTKYMLKEDYFKHKIISLVFFIIFSVSIDIVNYGNIYAKYGGIICIILIICIVASEALIAIIQRNLMVNYFYSPYFIISFFGFIELIFTIILGTITYFANGLFCQGDKCRLPSIVPYFDDFEFKMCWSILISLLFKAGEYLLASFIIYYLSVNHICVVYILGKFFENVTEGKNSIWSFILFFFLFFSFLLYLEILELNFCEINKQTKKNIEDRAKRENLTKFSEEDERKEARKRKQSPAEFRNNSDSSGDEIDLGGYKTNLNAADYGSESDPSAAQDDLQFSINSEDINSEKNDTNSGSTKKSRRSN